MVDAESAGRRASLREDGESHVASCFEPISNTAVVKVRWYKDHGVGTLHGRLQELRKRLPEITASTC